jgi:Tfp pilus assembly major pilin PilA
MESNKRYDELLKKAHQTGDYNQVRHLPGWRDIRKSSAVYLYRNGKLDVKAAIKYGAKIPDHLAAFEGGHVKVEDLIAAGVDIRRMDSYRKQQATKAGIAHEVAVKSERVIASVTVKSANGQVKVMASKPVHKPTAQEIAVAVAVANSQAREKARLAAAKVRERGVEVTLSEQEKAALLARLNAKSY